MTSPRVLVAGTEGVAKRAASTFFDQRDVPYGLAESSQELFAAPASATYDLIVLAELDRALDVVARELRASPTLNSAYLVALQAPSEDCAAAWFNAGIDDFLDGELTEPSIRRRLIAALAVAEGQREHAVPAREVAHRMRLADRMATVGQLAAGIAHELNTPLAYVLLNIESARKSLSTETSDPGAVECLDFALEGCEQMRAVLGDLRRATKRGQAPVGPEDVVAHIESALRLSDAHLRAHDVRVECSFEVRPKVHGRTSELVQVFTNLVLNALQAMRSGVQGELRIGVRVEQKTVEITVADNGAGIPAALQPKLFQPFFTTKGSEGTGLGLAICHRIIASYGGTIAIQSTEAIGTRVIIRLPEVLGGARASVPRARRMLIVEDDVSLGKTLRRLLAGIDVVLASDGADAVRILEHDDRFDLVLCDLTMPKLDGLGVYSWVKTHRAHLTSHFVLMTGGAPRGDDRLDDDELQVLYKPFSMDALQALVDSSVAPDDERGEPR